MFLIRITGRFNTHCGNCGHYVEHRIKETYSVDYFGFVSYKSPTASVVSMEIYNLITVVRACNVNSSAR